MLVENAGRLAIWVTYISNLSIWMKRGITEHIQWPLGDNSGIFSLIFHKGYSNCLRPYLLNVVSLWKHPWVSMYETQRANQAVRMYSHSPKRKTTQSSLVPPSVSVWPAFVSSLCNKSRKDGVFISRCTIWIKQNHSGVISYHLKLISQTSFIHHKECF